MCALPLSKRHVIITYILADACSAHTLTLKLVNFYKLSRNLNRQSELKHTIV